MTKKLAYCAWYRGTIGHWMGHRKYIET